MFSLVQISIVTSLRCKSIIKKFIIRNFVEFMLEEDKTKYYIKY